MTHFTLNGVETTVPHTNRGLLHELIQEIRTGYSSETALISSIKVNGVEIDAQDESFIGSVPVNDLKSVEVFTAHPKEIAEDTLQSMIEFSSSLEILCQDVAAQLLQKPPRTENLPRLADGITTFIDALTNVKTILHVGVLPKVQVLEADMVSVLKDMLDYQSKSEFAYVGAVLKDGLAQNLSQWRAEGIPLLIRLRDS